MIPPLRKALRVSHTRARRPQPRAKSMMSLFPRLALISLVATPLLTACSSELSDESAPEPSATAEAALGGYTVVGDIQGGGYRVLGIPPSGALRAVTFHAEAGDIADVWVGGYQRLPRAWLLSPSNATLAYAESPTPTSYLAHIIVTLPVGGTYTIVVGDGISSSHATLKVELRLGCATANQVVSAPCGAGGSMSKICVPAGAGLSGQWSPFGACHNEIVGGCVPGASSTDGCGLCGTRTRVCNASHAWVSGACTGQPVDGCSPGSVRTSPAGCSLPGTARKSTCTDACRWGSFSVTCG